MSFATVLNSYCNALGCTNKVIAERCGISASALSRYRNGGRTPDSGGEVVARLVAGISSLSMERGVMRSANAEVLRKALEGSLSGSRMLGMSFAARIDALVNFLGMKNSEVARRMGVSQSYVSRIRSGQRMPGNYKEFAQRFARMASLRCTENGLVNDMVDLIASSGGVPDRTHLDMNNLADLSETVEQWLLGNNVFETDVMAVEGLLEKINSLYFLDAYEALQKTELIPKKDGKPNPEHRFYYGQTDMFEAEITFFETAAAYGAKRVFLSSDVPLLELPLVYDHLARYAPGIATVTREGDGRIAVLHSAERPLTETALIVENWLPLYLTGSVVPYYLRGVTNRLFYHINYSCEVCVLATEAVAGHQVDGRSYFSTMPEDVAYYSKKLDYIMENASPMIRVFKECLPGGAESYAQFVEQCSAKCDAKEVAVGCYSNLRIMLYSGECAIISVLADKPIHIAIFHPKLRYVLAHM